MSAIAITDTGNLHGCHEMYTACKQAGITPILGAEVYVQSSLDDTLNHKLVLLSKSLLGYRNLIALISKGSLDNPGQIPYVTLDDVKEVSADLVCLSGPISVSYTHLTLPTIYSV